MDDFRYIQNVVTLQLDEKKCVRCGMCVVVCPHRIFTVDQTSAKIFDRDGCMECGACANNCPEGAITVTPGVGCASYIIKTWIKRKGSRSRESTCC